MKSLWRVMATACAAALITTGLASAAHAATVFVVNSEGDGGDQKVNGVCQTATVGECTLRAAITEATKASGPVTIQFNIPGSQVHTIQLASRLPQIANPDGVTIDGYSQPGSVANSAQFGSNAQLKIQISGQGSTFNIFYITSPNNRFTGLSVYNARLAFWAVGDQVNHNSWTGNFICTDASGTVNSGGINPGGGGILLDTGPNHNYIGVPDNYDPSTPASPADRNVISGCSHRGVIISNKGTDFNRVSNNLVGLRPDNSGPNGNYSHGIDVNYNAQDNMIGGFLPSQANVVSGNIQEGIEVSHGPYNRRNSVIGNFIGTDATGTTAPSWAGNGMMGIRMEGEKECDPCELNSGYHEVAYNVVVGNQGGIQVDKNTQYDNIHDNLVGVLPDGTPAGNALWSVRLEQGAFHHLFYRNTFANNAAGIQVQSTASQPPNSYVIPPLDNTFSQNSIYNNGALGIDLAPYNNPNINGTADPNVANGIQAPAIKSVTPTTVTVATCASCKVELFDTGKTPGTYKGLTAFGQGKTYLGTGTADRTGLAVLDMSASPVRGSTVLSATTTDPDGNTSEFSRIVAFVGATAPVVTTPTAVRYTNQHTYTLSGTGTEDDVVSLTVSDGTRAVTGTATVDENQNWSASLDLGALSDGPLTVTAFSTNPAGATSSDVTASTTKRVLPLTPTFTRAGPATATNRTAVPVTGSGDPGVTVALSATDGVTTATGTATAGNDGTWAGTLDVSALTDGSLTLTAVASDASGSSQTATTTLAKKTTATLPTIDVAGPSDLGNRTATPLSGTGGPDDTINLVVSDGVTSVTGQATVTTAGTWSTTVDVSSLSDGSLTATASATNALGSTAGPVSKSFLKATATARPTISAPTTVNGTTVSSVTVSGTSTAGASLSVTAQDANASTLTASTTASSGGAWSVVFNLMPLVDGTVTFSAVANDGTNGPSQPATVTTTKAALATAPAIISSSFTGNSVSITWKAPTDTRGVALTGYTLTSQAGTGAVKTTSIASTATTYTLTGLAGGTSYTLSLRANTSAGAGAASTLSITTKALTKMTVAVSTTAVPVGGSVVISGTLYNSSTGTTLGNKQINIKILDTAGGVNKISAKIVTDANGNYSYSYKPTRSAQYQGSFKGETTIAASNSAKSALVTVG